LASLFFCHFLAHASTFLFGVIYIITAIFALRR
jgi:hypothetical protein